MHHPRYLEQLTSLPRPVYGQVQALPNIALDYVHSHPWVQFSYASQGVLEVLTANGRYVAPSQRAVWIPSGVEHQVRCSGHTRIRSLYIENSALDALPEQTRVVQVSALLRELIQAFSQLPGLYDEAGMQGRLAQVLLDQLQLAPALDSMLPLPQDARALQLALHLQQQPDCQLGLAHWARQLAISEKTLSRIFQRETGLGFRLWRQRLRILSSLALLEQQQQVTEVALACGYDSVSAFISAFTRHFGCTPGEFFHN